MVRHFGSARAERSNQKAKIVALLSLFFLLVFSGLAVLLLRSDSSTATVQQPVVEEAAPQVEMVRVLIPLRSIKLGDPLEPTLFRRESRPKTTVSGNVVNDFADIAGMFAKVHINGGQPLTVEHLSASRPSSLITSDIPQGYRAITIRVDVTSSVEGWARAGAFVDVVWNSRIRGKPAVIVIVQNAKILSAERVREVKEQAGAGGPVPNTVTLLVTAAEAQKIQLAQHNGSLSLQLRGDSSQGKLDAELAPLTIDDLLGIRQAPQQREDIKGVVRLRGDDGSWETWVYKDGRLVPAEK